MDLIRLDMWYGQNIKLKKKTLLFLIKLPGNKVPLNKQKKTIFTELMGEAPKKQNRQQ